MLSLYFGSLGWLAVLVLRTLAKPGGAVLMPRPRRVARVRDLLAIVAFAGCAFAYDNECLHGSAMRSVLSLSDGLSVIIVYVVTLFRRYTILGLIVFLCSVGSIVFLYVLLVASC